MRYWDASAIVPLLVRQAHTHAMVRLLEDDPDIVTWWGTPVECGSALMRLARTGTLNPDAQRGSQRRLQELRDQWAEVVPSEICRRTAERMLRVHPLSAADSLQLAAAVIASDHDAGRLELVCLDERLSDAGRKEGFLVRPQKGGMP